MSDGSGFTIVDFTVPATRDTPVVHPCSEAPICDDCRSADLCFFDPTCSSCQDILSNPKTTISELFAIMRQWIPQTQRHLALLTREVLRRGAHINDKDGLTDLSLLHFASKAGAGGISNGTSAANLVNTLLNKGASVDLKCHWTDMNALHYAVFFDCADVVELLCQHDPGLVVSTSSQFNGGNSLHIAALNLSLTAAKILVKYNADAGYKDSNNLLPHEYVPSSVSKKDEKVANELKDLLQEASLNRPKTLRYSESPSSLSPNTAAARSPASKPNKTTPSATPSSKAKAQVAESSGGVKAAKADNKPITAFARQDSKGSGPSSQHSVDSGSPVIASGSPVVCSSQPSTLASNSPDEVTLETLGVKIGDRVIIDSTSAKAKRGTLRFAGETMFSSGQWAGIELDDDTGRNDGSHAGIRYFSCKPKRGLFVALRRIIKDAGAHRSSPAPHSSSDTPKGGGTDRKQSDPRIRSESFVTARAIEAHSQVQISSELQIGDHVIVSGRDRGVLRYAGAVKFAPGFWLGVELNHARGNCDGSKGGKQYFKCKPNHGIFVLPSKLSKLRSKDSIESSSPSPNPPQSSTEKKKSVSQPKTPLSTSSKGQTSSYTSPMPSGLSLASSPDISLEKGMSVFINREKGTIQYIGQTDFAPGIWLGIELKKPNGKNDGSVNGKRYFNCKPLCGIFVKPERATHRGINCAKLLKIGEK